MPPETPGYNPESEKSEKEIRWERIRAEVDEEGDLKGKGIDEKIKETVISFLANEFPTQQSCEGHLSEKGKYDIPAPWVSVSAANKPEWRVEHEQEIYEQVAKKYGISVDEVIHADNQDAWTEAVQLSSKHPESAEYKAWEEENKKLYEKMEKLLEEFYRERGVSDEVRLVLEEKVGGFRVHNGGKFYIIPNDQMEGRINALTKEDRGRIPEVLKNAQQEMNVFTQFLKEKYFTD